MPNNISRNAVNKDFSRNPQINHPRSLFPLAEKNLLTLNGSYLVPIYMKQVNPGETFEIDMSIFMRLMPQVAPVMDKIMMKTYFFYEPCRLLCNKFTKMMGEKEDPEDTIDYVMPVIEAPEGGWQENTIFDYMSLPINIEKDVAAMPFRMYNDIYNQFFRSEQLNSALTVKRDESDDSASLYELKKKNKIPDYFTRNLPDTQAGDPVLLPITEGAIPVRGNGKTLGLMQDTITGGIANFGTAGLVSDPNMYDTDNGTAISTHTTGNANKTWGVTTDSAKSGLVADLSQSVMASIIAVRQALATQAILEADNRGGVRWSEILANRYGTIVPDLFVGKPQYLGGTAVDLTTLPITQTSGTGASGTPQGNITGNTVGSDGGGVVRASFSEFGYVMGLVCLSVEPQYQQGLEKLYTQRTRYDFYHPEFNGVGDQATYNQEIYCVDQVLDADGNDTSSNTEVFGYNERCAEYKTAINHVHGFMRSNSSLPLDVYHYAEYFENLPTLNSQFLEDPAEDTILRTLAVQYLDEEQTKKAPQALMNIQFMTRAYRGMPVYNMPAKIV